MDAHDHRAAVFVVLDQVHLPQRMRAVQRRGRQFAGPHLQRGAFALSAPAREPLAHHMALNVEIRVVDPIRQHGLLNHLLAEAPVAQQP
jgi:hypothetical protein